MTATLNASCCSVCDAPIGECSHDAPRYLPEVVYEKAARGWRAPDSERERWERPVMALAIKTKPSDRQPRPLQELVVALEGHLDLDHPLERLLRACYDAEPMKVTLIVERTIDGGLRSPGGFLYKRLSDINMPSGD